MTTAPLMPIIAANPKLTSVLLADSATSLTDTIQIPPSTRAGDLIVLYDAPSYPGSGSTGASPSGFSTIVSAAFGGWFNGIQLSGKIATSSDAGSTITGMNGTTSNAKVMYVFRGNARINSFTSLNGASAGTNGDPGTVGIVGTGVVAPAILLCVASTYTAQIVNFQGYPSTLTTPAFQTVTNSVSRLCTGVSVISVPTAAYQQNIDMADLGSGNFLVGLWLQLA